MISLQTNFSIPANIYYQQVQDEAVLLDTVSGKYFGLNPVGASAWQRLAQGENLQQIFAALLEEYEVAPAQLEADLLALFEKLVEKGLLQTAP